MGKTKTLRDCGVSSLVLDEDDFVSDEWTRMLQRLRVPKKYRSRTGRIVVDFLVNEVRAIGTCSAIHRRPIS